MTPTQSATVLVALAAIGATPLNSRAGKAIKLPPPATALSAPPRAPATKRKIAVSRPKYKMYHVWGAKKAPLERLGHPSAATVRFLGGFKNTTVTLQYSSLHRKMRKHLGPRCRKF